MRSTLWLLAKGIGPRHAVSCGLRPKAGPTRTEDLPRQAVVLTVTSGLSKYRLLYALVQRDGVCRLLIRSSSSSFALQGVAREISTVPVGEGTPDCGVAHCSGPVAFFFFWKASPKVWPTHKPPALLFEASPMQEIPNRIDRDQCRCVIQQRKVSRESRTQRFVSCKEVDAKFRLNSPVTSSSHASPWTADAKLNTRVRICFSFVTIRLEPRAPPQEPAYQVRRSRKCQGADPRTG